MTSLLKTYSELSKLNTLEERFNYLKLDGIPTNPTFGGRRILSQDFYSSEFWRRARRQVILRDSHGKDFAFEMGLEPYTINSIVYVHHINSITIDDVLNHSPSLFDPENLICVSYDIHEALHYSDDRVLNRYLVVERTKNDTCPWKV